MPISGLVLTLTQDSRLAHSLTQELHRDPRVTVGDRVGEQLPIVVETGSIDEDRTAFEELTRTPGVLFVELAYHDFSDVQDFGDGPPRRRRLHTLPTLPTLSTPEAE